VFFLLLLSKGEYKFKKLNPTLMKKFYLDTRPIIFATVITVFYTNFKMVLIGLTFGPEALAYYNFIDAHILAFLLLITSAINPLYLSVYSKKFSQNKKDEIQTMANLIEKYSSLLFLFIMIFVFLNAELLFAFFLPNYMPSVYILYLLIFIPYIASINRPYSMLFVPGKKQKFTSKYGVIKVMILLLIIIVVVPTEIFSIKMLGLGVIGLCVIELLKWISDIIVYRYTVNKFFAIKSYKKIYIHILVMINVLFITYMVKEFILINIFEHPILIISACTIISLGLFLLELILLKEIQRSDVRFVLSLLKIKTYKDSLIQELLIEE